MEDYIFKYKQRRIWFNLILGLVWLVFGILSLSFNDNDFLPGWQLISAIAKVIGAKVNYDSHQKIFAAMQADHAELKDVKVSYKPSKASFKSTQLDFAPKW